MKTFYLTLLGVAPLVLSSPMNHEEAPIYKRNNPTYKDCHADQEKAIKVALKDMETLATGAKTADEKNKGWSHYFNAGDSAHVKKGFEAFESSSKTAYNFKCSTDKDICTSGVFAAADPTPEDFAGGPHVKGTRTITICPAFTTEPTTKRTLDEKDYCEHKESKKLKDFETGGHTLLHEISHLDTFGLAAGYPEETQPPKNGVPEFKYHGTIDWKGISTAGNARTLKTSKAKNKPETWQNAESFAASATEIYAMKKCEIKEVDL